MGKCIIDRNGLRCVSTIGRGDSTRDYIAVSAIGKSGSKGSVPVVIRAVDSDETQITYSIRVEKCKTRAGETHLPRLKAIWAGSGETQFTNGASLTLFLKPTIPATAVHLC